MMMQLGRYQFSINAARYNQLQRDTTYLWAAQNRVGGTPSRQFGGLGDDTLTISGVVFPQWRGGVWQVEAMRSEARKGKPLILVSAGWALGRNVFGYWTLNKVTENQSWIGKYGDPAKQEFGLELTYYGMRPR
ncbi:MAG: hypothetical protein BWK73_04680 [Thiothrix lacustris]|uniref:Phage tail protein n=1 Tax=Thiothrix lacustris TaxID=525917 RepID=A0A1Y1QYE0_9GAMM|nr:MAG: hypothetical protein BWK73_04680 [Thiothrix lacustris]